VKSEKLLRAAANWRALSTFRLTTFRLTTFSFTTFRLTTSSFTTFRLTTFI
jgi:hypothetical protein